MRPAIFSYKRFIHCLVLFMACLPLTAQNKPGQATLLPRVNRSGEHYALLDRGWYYLPGIFLDPATDHIPAEAMPVKVPANLLDHFGSTTPRYGTYICQIRVPWPERVSLKSEQFEMSYTLYANNQLVAQAGRPGASLKEEQPAWTARIFTFPTPAYSGEVFTLVMHASGFNDTFFGFIRPFQLGEETALRNKQAKSAGYEIFMVGIMLVMALYYFIVWASRRKEKSALVFAAMCLVLGLRPLFYGEYVVYYFWPDIPMHVLMRLGYLTMSLGMVTTPWFLHLMFPRSISRSLFRIGFGFGALYSLIILFTPLVFFTTLLPFVQLVIVVFCIIFIVCLVLALLRKETGAWTVVVGFFMMAVAIVVDIMSARVIISLPSVLPLGFLSMIMCLSIALTQTYALAFSRVESMAEELASTNEAMERFVPSDFLEQLGHKRIADIGLGEYVERDMVVLFSDIRSFTSIADELGPADTFSFLNEWLACMGPIIRAHGGFVDKYLGDGILALFYPDKHDVLNCAVAMQQETGRMSASRQAAGFEPLQIGIGIHRGILALGTIGESARMDTTVISDTVNVASRLEAVTKEFGSRIIISRELLVTENGSGHAVRALGKVSVKGKKKPVDLFEVIDSDPVDIRRWKDQSAERFSRGLACYFSQDFKEAVRIFHALLQERPDDQAAQYYARMARKLSG